MREREPLRGRGSPYMREREPLYEGEGVLFERMQDMKIPYMRERESLYEGEGVLV